MNSRMMLKKLPFQYILILGLLRTPPTLPRLPGNKELAIGDRGDMSDTRSGPGAGRLINVAYWILLPCER